MNESETRDRTTIKDAAKILGVTEKSIQRYLASGLLTKIKEGNRSYVLISEVNSLSETRGTGQGHRLSEHRGTTSRGRTRDCVTMDRERFESLLIELGELRKQVQILLEYKTLLDEKDRYLKDMDKELEQLRTRIRATETRDTDMDTELAAKAERIAQLEAELSALKALKPWWQR